MVTDERMWEAVVVNELQAKDLEAKQALQWLVEYVGSVAAAGRFLNLDFRVVDRNLERIEARRRLSPLMLKAIREGMQLIPRQRSDNPLERLVWTVESLEERARVQRRATIEVRDRIRELEIVQQGPPVRWHATLERLRREAEAQLKATKVQMDTLRQQTEAQLTEAKETLDTLRRETEAQLKAIKTQIVKAQLVTKAMLNAIEAIRPNALAAALEALADYDRKDGEAD